MKNWIAHQAKVVGWMLVYAGGLAVVCIAFAAVFALGERNQDAADQPTDCERAWFQSYEANHGLRELQDEWVSECEAGTAELVDAVDELSD